MQTLKALIAGIVVGAVTFAILPVPIFCASYIALVLILGARDVRAELQG